MQPLILFALIMVGWTPDDREVLLGVKTAAEHNLAQFQGGWFNYEYAHGPAATIEEVKRPDWKPEQSMTGAYAFHGTKLRYERLQDAADVQKTRDVKNGSIPSPSARLLSNGTKTFYDDGLLPRSQIVAGDKEFYHQAMVPLNVGFSDSNRQRLCRDLAAILDRRPDALQVESIDPAADFNGEKMTKIVLRSSRSQYRKTYWVDLEHGAIPRRELQEDPRRRFIMDLDDVRRIPGKGWYPYSQTILLGTFGKRLRLVALDFTKPPGDEYFQIRYEQPREVLDMTTSARYAPRKVWSLDALPKPGEKLYSPVVIDREPAPELVRNPASMRTPWPWVLGGAGLGLLLGVAAYYLCRRWQLRG